MALTSYIAYSQADNKGDVIEIITGTSQEIVDAIRDRRKLYGPVHIVNMDWDDSTGYAALLEYKIKTT